MNDSEIDGMLNKAASETREVEPALRKRIADSIGPSLRPVKPLPPTWVLAAGLMLIWAAVALVGAARAGFYGVEKLDGPQRVIIFATLAVFSWLAGIEFTGEMIPGSRRRVSADVLVGVTCAGLLGVFAMLFRDYHTARFVHAGVVCLAVGLVHAAFAGLLAWIALRRGFAVKVTSAGLAAGVFAGLAGVTMLELHCDNFQALHVILWHTAVVPVSGAIGALLGWALHE